MKIFKLLINLIPERIKKKVNFIYSNIVSYYNVLVDAFSNWDMDLHDFLDQIKFMITKTSEIVSIIISKLRYVIYEFRMMILELVNTLSNTWRK